MMVINESDGVPYYYNYVSGESVWDPPAEYVAHLEQEQVVEAPHEDARVVEDDGAVDLAEHVTPEVEDKVRRAIESVSKTPVGSSRLLLVRTPTLKGSRPSSSSASTARRPASASQTSRDAEPAAVAVMTIEPPQQNLDELQQK
ncbi:hypothetical protein PINS_up019965 [Pythium insidiosum]|nr:hypothetical protein PINS_up019965 [Pythium insidiosum]